jgi:hypothetical protein
MRDAEARVSAKQWTNGVNEKPGSLAGLLETDRRERSLDFRDTRLFWRTAEFPQEYIQALMGHADERPGWRFE